ncbi:MAG: insulinase family protein [Deltaproteobacteria bacterium]|nr:insulinase family protein [Deltaproteobacteria bacterium]
MLAPLGLALLAAAAAPAPKPAPVPAPASAALVDIPFEQFTLDNGLRVVVHTDKKAPIVAVNVWYHVGSKDEPAGRSGFAHLFEHLMFNGSENHPGEYFAPFELVGATDMNGTTWFDRTNYFQNVPKTALETALWMESDRMGHLLGAVDQARLDEQRGVVQNEKRQGENQPYGAADDRIYEALYPAGHPYHHSTIGSMNDLNAASLDDVKGWFKAAYGPNNAVLVLAGDVDVATAKELVTRYFGDIPPGPGLVRPAKVAAAVKGTRGGMTDQVPQARLYRAYSVARYGDVELDRLQLLAQILGGSASSRLDQRLVHKDKIADMVQARVDAFELSSTFMVQVDVKEGVDVAVAEKAVDEELARLMKDGPTAAEVEQARTVFLAGFVRGVERIGGFGGKADTLAECAVYTGDPGCFRQSLQTLSSAKAADLKASANRWLKPGGHTFVVTPGERVPAVEPMAVKPEALALKAVNPKLKAVASTVDRTKGVPMPAEFPKLAFPTVQRATLKNGTKLILAERHDVPVVQLSYVFAGGYTADQGKKLGTASFAMAMLTEGAGVYGALDWASRAEALGARISADAELDDVTVAMSALKAQLEPSLELFSTTLRSPRFDAAELERVRATWIANIKQEKVQPQTSALRVLPPLLYGAGHAYAVPFTGSGTEASIASLTRDDLVAFARAWLRPEAATLVVVGDTTLAELVPLLDKHLGDWAGVGAVPALPKLTTVALPKKPRVYLVDQPGALQATIFVGQLVPSSKDPAQNQLFVANAVLGGEFSSRLNMNLREDKHWAYGAYSFAMQAVGQRPWAAFAPVQIDKTAEALKELSREIGEYTTGKAPAKPDELAKIQATEIRGLPGSFETAGAVLRTLVSNHRYARPDDYVAKRQAELEGMTLPQVTAAARTIRPEALTWVVVGDRKTIEAGVRALNLGEVKIVDADGNPVAGR